MTSTETKMAPCSCLSAKSGRVGHLPGGQWLRLHVSDAEGESSISGRGTNISQAAQCGKKKKKNQVKLQFAEWQSCDFCWEVGGRIDPPGNPLSSASQLPTLSSSILTSVAWQVVRPDLTSFFLSQTGQCQVPGPAMEEKKGILNKPWTQKCSNS